MSRKLTHRNLQAALRYIDRDTPEKSLLLTAPSAAHGGAQSAVFSSRDRRQVEQLQQWAGKVARLLDDAPTTIARPDAVLLQPSQQSNLPWMRSLEATRLTGKEAGQGKASSVWKEENLGWEQERPSGKGIFKPPFVPRDPFDAEIFNRRYGLTDIKQHETQARTNTTPAVQDSSRFRSSKSQGILPPPRPKSFPIAPDGGAKTGP